VRLADAERVARRILADVRRHGDRALIRYAKKFDGQDLDATGFELNRKEIEAAYKLVPRRFVAALRVAARNIRAVARQQMPRRWQINTTTGVRVSQIIRPLRRVACYVPGGRFPLPSTVLMSVIPAQVAGVEEIVITSPRPAPAVLVTADLLGIRRVFRLGGAQAIAAFAYGTRRVPRADKIVGPGNRFVAAAKKLIAGECGIDFIAGPTELVIAGAKGRAGWIAADLIAQAEHDPDAVAIFITPSRPLADRVAQGVGKVLARLNLPIAEMALARQGAIVVTRDLAEAIELVNRFAPEHLTLLEDAAEHLDRIESAGSIFLGDYSAVAAGDYASGTNHVLPTGGVARLRGGLSAADFVKVITTQRLSRAGLARLRQPIVTLANAEGLRAHAHSVDTRFKL
jgi:histidinol dehydrogenase